MYFFFSDKVVLLFEFWNVHSPAGKKTALSEAIIGEVIKGFGFQSGEELMKGFCVWSGVLSLGSSPGRDCSASSPQTPRKISEVKR